MTAVGRKPVSGKRKHAVRPEALVAKAGCLRREYFGNSERGARLVFIWPKIPRGFGGRAPRAGAPRRQEGSRSGAIAHQALWPFIGACVSLDNAMRCSRSGC